MTDSRMLHRLSPGLQPQIMYIVDILSDVLNNVKQIMAFIFYM